MAGQGHEAGPVGARLVGQVAPGLDHVIDRPREAEAARLGQGGEFGGAPEPGLEALALVDRRIAEADADLKAQAQLALDRHRAVEGRHGARKLGQDEIALGFYQASPVPLYVLGNGCAGTPIVIR